MNNEELLAKIRNNLFHLHMSMMDAPYHGLTKEEIAGVEFAISKVLKGTGITVKELVAEGFGDI